MKIEESWKKEDGRYECPFCNKKYSKMGLGNHIWRNHGEGKNHDPNRGYKLGTKKIWNKGLTTKTDSRMLRITTKFNDGLKTGRVIPSFLNKKHKEESIQKMKKNGGGPRKGAGRGIHGWYKGYWCDSTWELAYVIFNLEHGIEFSRNSKGFEYDFENTKHKFYPDFILRDGSYVEIKGRIDIKNQAKLSGFREKLILIGPKEIDLYLKYAMEKYGFDFFNLYENHTRAYPKKERVYRARKEYLKKKAIEFDERQKPLIEKVTNSDIDFSKFGWVRKVSELTGMAYQGVGYWMKKYMPDFYESNCFKRHKSVIKI